MSFDSDNAGAKAAERGWMMSLAEGMDVKIAVIPKGFDPADLILNDKEKFKTALRSSVHIIDFVLDKVLEENKDQRKIGLALKNSVLPYVYLLDSSIEKSHYISKISEKTHIPEDAIREDLKKVKLSEDLKYESKEENTDKSVKEQFFKNGSAERSLAGIIVRKSDHTNSKKLLESIENILSKDHFKKFKEELDRIGDELAFEAEEYYGDSSRDKMEKEIEYLLINLKEDNYKQELNELLLELKRAEKSKETDKAISILRRCNEITQKLNEIRKEKNNNYKSSY